MKAVSYKQDQVHSSPDGKTVCWLIYRGEYLLQTTDPQVANVISRWKDIEEVGRGEIFLRLYRVPYHKIDRVIEAAKLPPRISTRKGVKEAEKVSLGV